MNCSVRYSHFMVRTVGIPVLIFLIRIFSAMYSFQRDDYSWDLQYFWKGFENRGPSEPILISMIMKIRCQLGKWLWFESKRAGTWFLSVTFSWGNENIMWPMDISHTRKAETNRPWSTTRQRAISTPLCMLTLAHCRVRWRSSLCTTLLEQKKYLEQYKRER
jgi:hypothetical protein